MTTTVSAADKPEAKTGGRVRHIVVFKLKEDAKKADVAKMDKAFRALKGKIPGIVGFEAGINNSPEGLNNGFTHIYIVTFENEAARDAYLPHPEHKAFVEVLKPVLEDVFVVDFTAGGGKKK